MGKFWLDSRQIPYYSDCHAVINSLRTLLQKQINLNPSGYLGVGLSKCQNWGFPAIYNAYFAQWVLISQSCPNLCNPMDCSPPGSSVHGILLARILDWVAISFSGIWLRFKFFFLIGNKITTEFIVSIVWWMLKNYEFDFFVYMWQKQKFPRNMCKKSQLS